MDIKWNSGRDTNLVLVFKRIVRILLNDWYKFSKLYESRQTQYTY